MEHCGTWWNSGTVKQWNSMVEQWNSVVQQCEQCGETVWKSMVEQWNSVAGCGGTVE